MDTQEACRILQVSSTSPRDVIRRAYHQALLTHHPDKSLEGSNVAVDDVKRAYLVLTASTLPTAGAASVQRANAFHYTIDLDDFSYDAEHQTFSYPCRCGNYGGFTCTEADLDAGVDMIACPGCSSIVRVDYAVVE